MNDRERWIIYPLLFLALGAALRDKLIKQTRAKEIVCETLYLVDSEGRQMAFLNGSTLRFDIEGGVANGFIRSNVIDADAITQRGQRVSTGGTAVRSPQDLLRMLQQFRLPQGMIPANPQNPPKTPPTTNEPSDGAPANPGTGPKLQPPAEPPGDA